jgi:hypothetical protein
MACSVVASHTRGSSTYGLPNEAGNARHRSRWPHQHPWLLVLPHPYTFPHICILAYHLRGADLGRGIVVTKPSRSGRFRIRGFYENSVRRVVLRRRYVSRRCVDFYFAGRVVEYVTHCHEPPRTRAHAALVSCMWPLSQPALTLDSPHLACPLALPPATSEFRSRHKRTHATDNTSTAVYTVRAILPSSVHECDMACEGMRMLGGMRCLS